MGSITTRKAKDGSVRYRAVIRIRREGFPDYSESRTFGTRKLAETWLKKREVEIEENPKILQGQEKTEMTIGEAIVRYLNEVRISKKSSKYGILQRLSEMPISKHQIETFHVSIISEHVKSRHEGFDRFSPITPSSINVELSYMRSVFQYAEAVWGLNIDLNSLNKTLRQLSLTKQISLSVKRDRLPTTDELTKLTLYFKERFESSCKRYPMHLIMWLAIFSCRREAEITRLEINDYQKEQGVCLVKNIKNPKGSQGNNKFFHVLPECAKMIELILKDKYRDKMLSLGYSNELIVPCSSSYFSQEFFHACNILGIEDLRFHDLRHEGCTRLAERGFTIPQIQHISLHDSWSSLQRYVSVQKRFNVLQLEDVLKLIDEN